MALSIARCVRRDSIKRKRKANEESAGSSISVPVEFCFFELAEEIRFYAKRQLFNASRQFNISILCNCCLGCTAERPKSKSIKAVRHVDTRFW